MRANWLTHGFKVILTPQAQDDLREIIHRPYQIVYEIFPEQNAVYVLRFWHGARGEPEIKP